MSVITGGAQGLGEAIARRLSEEGCEVWLLDINPSGSETAKTIEQQTGNPVRFIRTDVSSEESIQEAVDHIRERSGRVHILVNNAAAFVFKGVDATREDWDRILDVNIKGTSFVARTIVPLMRAAGGGSIVNLSSVSGFVGQEQFATYNATKFAIRGLTKCWAIDLAPDHIRVNTVCPGYIRTDAFEHSCRQVGKDPEEEDWRVSKLHLIGRQGIPAEVASAVVFLSSDDASFITGSDLMVDGGYLTI